MAGHKKWADLRAKMTPESRAKAEALAARMLDEIEAAQPLQFACGQAYQIIAALAEDLGIFGTDEIQRVLDNLHAAASGEPLTHKWVRPFIIPDRTGT